MKAQCWVIEIREGRDWVPCSVIGISRKEAELKLDDQRKAFPERKYRIRLYVRFKTV